MFRKFYDALPADAGGAAPAEAVVETPSAAAMMAKGGVKISAGEASPEPKKAPAATPPPKTESTPPAPTPAETAMPAPPANEPPKNEVKPATATPAAAAEPAKVETPTDWKQVLKTQKPDAVLTELGFDAKQVKMLETIKADPKMAKFFDVWASKGDVTAYLKAASTDYSKMAPEEVMRYSLREKYPDMSETDFKELYTMKVLERYKLDGNPDYTDAEARRARIELAADSQDHRNELVKRQQDFLLSVAPDQAPVDDGAKAAAEVQATKVANFKTSYQKHMSEDAFVKEVLNTKTIKIGEGEDAFKYTVDPEKLMGLLNDSGKWNAKMFKTLPDENGNGAIPNGRTQILAALIADDGDGFLNAYASHLKSLGANNAISPIENASSPGGTPAKGDTTPTDPAAKMAKSGRIVRAGE